MTAFAASGAFLRGVPRVSSLASLAVVTYGRDHDALIDIRHMEFYWLVLDQER